MCISDHPRLPSELPVFTLLAGSARNSSRLCGPTRSFDGLVGKKLKSNALNANGTLEDRPPSEYKSCALDMYESRFENVKRADKKTWTISSQDNKVMTGEICDASVLFNRKDVGPWMHSNKKIEPSTLFGSAYNDNNTTRISNIINFKRGGHGQQTQCSRMWFKPKSDNYNYEESFPTEISEAIHFKSETTVFIGFVHYDINGVSSILKKDEMTRSFEVCVSNGKSNGKGGHGFLDFTPTDEWARDTNSMSLVQFVCPKRRKGSQQQDSFSMAIKFNCNALAGTYEPVVFILVEHNSEYHLVPVVKYDLIILNTEFDSGSHYETFESSSSTGQATSMPKRKRVDVTTSSKRTPVVNSLDDRFDRIEANHKIVESLLRRVVNYFSIPHTQDEQPTDH